MERIHVRRRLKQVTTAQGWPVFGHIARAGPDGRPTRVFLQEELFGPGAYRQIVASHDSLARHHQLLAIDAVRACDSCTAEGAPMTPWRPPPCSAPPAMRELPTRARFLWRPQLLTRPPSPRASGGMAWGLFAASPPR